jgi:cytochrome c oxidase subunit 2
MKTRRTLAKLFARTAWLVPGVGLSGCDGVQSVLSPAGEAAAQTERLFWVMLIGAAIIWCALNLLLFYVSRLHLGAMPRWRAEALIIGGGVVFPVFVLGGLLAYSLPLMPGQREAGEGLRIRVTGEEWWWRVEYFPQGAGDPIVSANEVRLPVGERVEFELVADDVIHAFWIPALGGKTDMIPGRTNRMSLKATEPGVYRGQCAEFCGESHALMSLQAVVLPPEEFETWLVDEAADAMPPATPEARAGESLFRSEGCPACHAVRGAAIAGAVGPDLTHLGSRHALAAAALPMTREALVRWLTDPAKVKPGAEMPGYGYLDKAALNAITAYLEGLR